MIRVLLPRPQSGAPQEGCLEHRQASGETRVRGWGWRGKGKVGATEDTPVWKREQSLWQDVRTQKKIRKIPCWTPLDEHQVLVSGRTGGHSRQRETNMCDPRQTETKGREEAVLREMITETTRLPRQRPEEGR